MKKSAKAKSQQAKIRALRKQLREAARVEATRTAVAKAYAADPELQVDINPVTRAPYNVGIPGPEPVTMLRKDPKGDPYEALMRDVPDLSGGSLADGLPDGYDSLRKVLKEAVEQASGGKGKARHANEGEAFQDQLICRLGRDLGNNGFQIGQACKKAIESTRLSPERARAELLGAINYLAAAVILNDETA